MCVKCQPRALCSAGPLRRFWVTHVQNWGTCLRRPRSAPPRSAVDQPSLACGLNGRSSCCEPFRAFQSLPEPSRSLGSMSRDQRGSGTRKSYRIRPSGASFSYLLLLQTLSLTPLTKLFLTASFQSRCFLWKLPWWLLSVPCEVLHRPSACLFLVSTTLLLARTEVHEAEGLCLLFAWCPRVGGFQAYSSLAEGPPRERAGGGRGEAARCEGGSPSCFKL